MSRLDEGSWWRRNRWGVVGLPLAVLAACAASSERVSVYYWQNGLHQPQRAEAGQWLTFSDTYHDADGEHPLDVRLRLDGVRETTAAWESSDPLDLPPGSMALEVTLSAEAEPDVPLVGCTLALLDQDGTRYEYMSMFAGAFQPSSPCVPPEAKGPFPSLGGELDDALSDDATHRPREWTVHPVVVVPRGATITEVLLWWEKPAYASLAVD